MDRFGEFGVAAQPVAVAADVDDVAAFQDAIQQHKDCTFVVAPIFRLDRQDRKTLGETLDWPVSIGSAEFRVGDAKTLFQEGRKRGTPQECRRCKSKNRSIPAWAESAKETDTKSLETLRFPEVDPVTIELSTDCAGVYSLH